MELLKDELFNDEAEELLYMRKRRKKNKLLQMEMTEATSSRNVLQSQGMLLGALFVRNPCTKICGQKVVKSIKQKSNSEFFKLCRITKEMFNQLVEKLTPHKNFAVSAHAGGYPKFNADIGLMITLWYLGRQCTYTALCYQFGLSQSSAHGQVEKVIGAINDVYKDVIQWPTVDKVLEVEKDFRNICNFPGIIGSLAANHIKIRAPPMAVREAYLDRTLNYYSINLLAVCNANKKFTYVNVGYPGSAYDQQVFASSELGIKLKMEERSVCYTDAYHLVGDSSFALRKYLMVPYTGLLNTKKLNFNTKLLITRQVIDESFALLTSRFQHLKFMDADLDKIASMVTAACILHNLTMDIEEERKFLASEGIEPVEVHFNVPPSSIRNSADGIHKRHEIMKNV